MSQNAVIFIAWWEPPTSQPTTGVTKSHEGFALVDIYIDEYLGYRKKVSKKRCFHQGPNEYLVTHFLATPYCFRYHHQVVRQQAS